MWVNGFMSKNKEEYDPSDNGSGLVGYGKSPDYGGPRYTQKMKRELYLFTAGFLCLTVGLPTIFILFAE